MDAWFGGVRSRYAAEMRCGRGCTLCCHGLFDIPPADAFLLARGLSRLAQPALEAARQRAAPIQRWLEEAAPELKPPWLLDRLGEARIDDLVDRAGEPRCPLLGDDGLCVVYEDRPLACRLEGVPMVDTRDGPFSDWCELNFVEGIPQGALADLRLDHAALEEEQARHNSALAGRLPFKAGPQSILFIPSLVLVKLC